MKTKIHLVPTFHHDIAYLKSEKDYHDMATKIINRAIDMMLECPELTYTVEQAYFFERYWNENPDKQESMKKLIKNKQLVFAPGMWVVPDMCMPSGESIYMQSTLGKRTLKSLVGIEESELDSAFIADCWGHHAQLPQILTQCGYKYYIFSRCMDKNFDKENFLWQGADESEIKSHWCSTGYAGIRFIGPEEDINAAELKWCEGSKEGILSLFGMNDPRCHDDPQLMPIGGDMKMPSWSMLELVPELQQDPEMPKLAYSTISKALSEVDWDKKDTYKGEFISCQKGSFTTNIKIKQMNNKLENLLYALEVLSVIKGKKIDLIPEWKTTLKNQFHDIICGTICDKGIIDAMREYDETNASLKDKLAQLSTSGNKASFNALPFEVEGIVNDSYYKLPPLSFGKKEALEKTVTELPEGFENSYYKATFNELGYITSLVDKATGKNVVQDCDIPFGSLQLQADNGDNWVEFEYPYELDTSKYSTNVPDPYDRRGLNHPNMMIAKDGVTSVSVTKLGDKGIRIEQKGELKFWVTIVPFTTTITLYNFSPRIDYHTEFDCNVPHFRLRAAFPTALEGGSVRHQIPYTLVERGEGHQPLSMFMDAEKDGVGLSLINRGLPSNNTENGVMMTTLFRSVAMEYKCESKLSYNLGEHIACDFAILPHPAHSDSVLWEKALEFNCPVIDTTDEMLNAIKVENAQLSALRYDGENIFVRLYNASDKATTAKLTLPDGIKQYTLADGCMSPIGEKRTFDKELELSLKPFQVIGILL